MTSSGKDSPQKWEQLHRTIAGLEGDFVTKLLIAFLGAGIALVLFTLAMRVGPLVVSWARGLFS